MGTSDIKRNSTVNLRMMDAFSMEPEIKLLWNGSDISLIVMCCYKSMLRNILLQKGTIASSSTIFLERLIVELFHDIPQFARGQTGHLVPNHEVFLVVI